MNGNVEKDMDLVKKDIVVVNMDGVVRVNPIVMKKMDVKKNMVFVNLKRMIKVKVKLLLLKV